jgi:hypothetical protein
MANIGKLLVKFDSTRPFPDQELAKIIFSFREVDVTKELIINGTLIIGICLTKVGFVKQFIINDA